MEGIPNAIAPISLPSVAPSDNLKINSKRFIENTLANVKKYTNYY